MKLPGPSINCVFLLTRLIGKVKQLNCYLIRHNDLGTGQDNKDDDNDEFDSMLKVMMKSEAFTQIVKES